MADVSATNAANVSLYDEAGNRVGTTANPLVNQDGRVTGTWGYLSGTTGTISVGTGRRVLQISVIASPLLAGSFTINGGQTITVPSAASLTVTPRANLVNPTLVFTGTASYFVEYVE